MILIATFLFFGQPKLRTEFGPLREPEAGWIVKNVPHCCGSMLPALHGGEVIYVSPPRPGEKLLGQIVNNGNALHMVTAETKDAVMTAGINNQYSDGWTPRTKVEYVVRYVVRNGAKN